MHVVLWRCREELLSVEEGVEAVCELVDELVEKASKVVFDHYLEKEAFSYTVQDAKEIILGILAVRPLAIIAK